MSSRRDHGRCAALAVAAALAVGCGAPPPAPSAQNGPPAVAQVRDGLGPDVDSQKGRSSLFANWDAFVDPEGSVVVYEWSIGSKPGETDVLPWTEIGGATNAAVSGIDLPIGIALHVNVRASDLAGSRSAIATSDGIVLGERAAATPATTGGAAPTAGEVGRLAALDRSGTTWTFDSPAQCGRFANGDWWVVGPVSIVAIVPASMVDGDRVRHGSMVNPDPKVAAQGYDSAMFGDAAGSRYDPALNVALGVSRTRPLKLLPGSSLVSATSHPQAGQLPQLESCVVLTCLTAPPPANALRPPYCGADKACRWTADQLDLSRLARLEAPEGAPALAELVECCSQLWLDHVPGWTGRYLHPRTNMPDYGRELADLVGRAALALQLDFAPEKKRALAIALVQIGIDNFGVVQAGGRFLADGGSGSGRKFPVLFAGALLKDDELLRCARQGRAFAEDVQTFYVAETAPGVWNHGHGGYTPDDAGIAEWGNRHGDDPSLDSRAWAGDPYRRCCTANAWHGYVLAARIMGLREAWGNEALFDYVDRYMQIEPRGTWTRSWSPFPERMWDTYRARY